MDTHLTDSEIIDNLGGPAELARLLDITPQAVSKWRKTGIPKAQRRFLVLHNPAAFHPKPSTSASGGAAHTPLGA